MGKTYVTPLVTKGARRATKPASEKLTARQRESAATPRTKAAP